MTRILSVVALAAVLPSVALASGARVAGLNVPGDYIKDYTGIFTYVSGVNNVGNLVYTEPNSGNETMGAVLGNLWEGRLGTWGVHLRRFHPALGQSLAGDPITNSAIGFPVGTDPNTNGEALDIMWGQKMGAGSLGLRLNRSFVSVEAPGGTVEGNGNLGRNVWGIGVGYGFAMNQDTDIELAGHFQNRSFQDPGATFPPDWAEDDGNTAILVAGRAMMKSSGNLMWVPVAKYYSFDISAVDATAPTPNTLDEKITGWQIGIAGNWSIGSDDLLVLGANVVGNRFEITTTGTATGEINETFYPNLFAGLESHVNSWLTLRFGAQNAVMYSVRAEQAGNPALPLTIKEHDFTYNMGAGTKIGSLMLDATLESGFWNNPVSGVWNNGLGADPFPRVSATYSF
jgi:hypothetical protein